MTTPTTEVKATKVTFLSLIEAGDVQGLVMYLVRRGITLEQMEQMKGFFAKIVPEFKKEVGNQQKAIKNAEKQEAQLNKKILASTKVARKAFVSEMLKIEGITKEEAEKLADKTFGVVERVNVSFAGVEFEVAKRGKASVELSNALLATGLSRDEFIEKYEI